MIDALRSRPRAIGFYLSRLRRSYEALCNAQNLYPNVGGGDPRLAEADRMGTFLQGPSRYSRFQENGVRIVSGFATVGPMASALRRPPPEITARCSWKWL